MRLDSERPVTVTVTGRGDATLTCSGLLERDPGHLHWNRLCLLGGQRLQLAAMRLMGAGLVRWRLYQRIIEGAEDYSSEEFGTAILRSVGIASGINIADDSIQKIAVLELFERTECVRGGRVDTPIGARYGFLQRPPRWDVWPKAWSNAANLDRHGRWYRAPSTGLRFRLAHIGHLRDEPRRTPEFELIEIPTVDIGPVRQPSDADTFFAEADTLWFIFKIGIAFWYRQYVTTLMEERDKPGSQERLWHVEAVEPLARGASREPPSVYGAFEVFMQRASAALFSRPFLHEQLHAAVFGYASSFRALASESALTACVEAIEGLLVAFETARNLTRDTLPRRDWTPHAKRLKMAVDAERLSDSVANAVKRMLATPPTFSLQDRIERMARHLRTRHLPNPTIFDNLERMIRLRNTVVHGRKVENHQQLYFETVRARAVFEYLLITFLNAHQVVSFSGLANTILLQEFRGQHS